MRRFICGIAAVALIAGGAYAQGQGQGQGNDRAPGGNNGKGQAMAVERSPGNSGNRGNDDAARGKGNAERGSSMAPGRPDRDGPDTRGNGNARGGPSMAASPPDRGPDMRGNQNANRGNDRAAGPANRASNANPVAGRGNGRDELRDVRITDRRDDRIFDVDRRGLIEGCPPGLARKNNGCMPPGLARQQDRRFADRGLDWWGLSGLGIGDGRYSYDDGYLLRLLDDGRVGGYVPLLGGALSPGNVWPDYYQPVRVPSYYENFYGLGGPDRYRYANNALYRVDPETAAITSVAALLTGDDIVVGQPMPTGYEVYNVPRSYRDRYYDTPQAYYRYSDGYVYEIDPETRLVAAAIELLV